MSTGPSSGGRTIWIDAALIRNWILETGGSNLLDMLRDFQRQGYQIHTTNIVESELRTPQGLETSASRAWDQFKQHNPGLVNIDVAPGIWVGPDRGELSIQDTISKHYSGGGATVFSDDNFTNREMYDAGTGRPIETAKTGDIIRKAVGEGVISKERAAALRDAAVNLIDPRTGNPVYGNYPGSASENPVKKGFQNFPTNDELNVERGYETVPGERGKVDYWDKSQPKPSNFRTEAENLALSNESANMKAAREAVAGEMRKLLADPSSYAGEALRPDIAGKLNVLGKALIAAGIAASAYDIATTAAKIQGLKDAGNFNQAAVEAAALLGRQEGAWIAGLAGAEVGADVGAVIGGILGAVGGPGGVAVGAGIGSVLGGLIGGALAGMAGYDYGDQIGRTLGDMYNHAAEWWNDLVRQFEWPTGPDGNPVNPWDPDSPYNPLHWFPPDSPIDPRRWFDPDSPWNPGRWFDPDNPISPPNWLPDLFGPSFFRRDPLVLDLNFDGVRLTSLNAEYVHFDLDGDGFAEKTGWISTGDAFLVLDGNGNGLIDNGTELFGSSTRDGFTALRDLDSNADGVITSADAQFGSLRLWIDANHDGVSQSAELVTLASRNIASIDLTAARAGWNDNGNGILFQGGFTLTNGTRHEAVAVDFATDQVHTKFNLPANFTLDPEVFSLPNLHGYGRVSDLWTAMSLDPELKQAVRDFIAGGMSAIDDSYGRTHLIVYAGSNAHAEYRYEASVFEDILARWAGIEISDGDDDALQIQATAEAFMNRATLPNGGGRSPNFQLLFQKFAANEAVRFYVQVAALRAGENVTVSFASGSLTLDQGVLPTASTPFIGLNFDPQADKVNGNPRALIEAEMADLPFDPNDPWAGYAGWLASHKVVLDIVDPVGDVLAERHRAKTGNLALDILQRNHQEHLGTAGSDMLIGDANGVEASDLFIGGAGDDRLDGGYGNDTYALKEGFGSDVVLDAAGSLDEIAFQGALTFDRAHFAFANGNRQDLLITFDGSSDQLTILGYFTGSGAGTIEKITFADGIQASARRIADEALQALGTSGPDQLSAFDIGSTLFGLAGNDELHGGRSDDVLTGGTGNDLVFGGAGDDVYRFGRGDGQDRIEDIGGYHYYGYALDGGNDRIEFAAGIAPEDVEVVQLSASDIALRIRGTTDQITIANMLSEAAFAIEQVRFADRTVWSRADVIAHSQTTTASSDVIYSGYTPSVIDGGLGDDTLFGSSAADTLIGGAGDDTLVGNAGADVLVGGQGNDSVAGGAGDDVYRFGRGDGHDRIEDVGGYHYYGYALDGGNDRIEFAVGIAPDDVEVVQLSANDIALRIRGMTDQITIANMISDAAFAVEQVRFADGTVWSYEEVLARSSGGTDGDDVINAGTVAATLAGGAGNDTLNGSNAGDTLIGGTGNDALNGRDGDDVLIGGTGADYLSGGAGNDVYRFGRDDGQDRIEDVGGYHYYGYALDGGNDRIEFAAGIAPEDVEVVQLSASDIALRIRGTTDQITIANMISDAAFAIEQVRFANGTAWSNADVIARSQTTSAGNDVIYSGYTPSVIDGGAGDDTLAGSSAADTLIGGTGNDTLVGNAGADVLVGGQGNDSVAGGAGDDVYRFGRGDGQDRIEDVGGYHYYGYALDGGNDRIEFAAGIASEDVEVVQLSANDIALRIRGTTDQITIANMISDAAFAIEQVRFSNGTVWNHADVIARSQTTSAGNDVIYSGYTPSIIDGGAGDDTLFGSSAADTLIGGTGNDRLEGGGEGDIYIHGLGDGDDLIYDLGGDSSASPDVLRFGTGISLQDLQIRFAANGTDLELALITLGGSVLIERQTWASAGIERVEFADGTVLNQAQLESLAIPAGGQSSSTITGTSSNDALYGSGLSDILVGRGGDDYLEGRAGSDEYRYARGDGDDVISDVGLAADADILRLLDLAPTEVELQRDYSRSGVTLWIKDIISGQKIRVDNEFISDGTWGIEQIVFRDGTMWDKQQIQLQAWLRGTSAGEQLFSGGSSDTFVGGQGDDYLEGNGGSDEYRYASGDGNDVIADVANSSDVDTLRLTNLNPSDVELRRDHGRGVVTMWVADKTTGQSVRIDNEFAGDGTWGIERLIFADGTVWDRARMEQEAWLRGTAGGEQLFSGGASNVFVGGKGDDYLEGNSGSDEYRYASGDGNDEIADVANATDTDVLKLTDLAATQIEFLRAGDDLYVRDLTTGQQIRVDHQFASDGTWGIERVVTADGVTFDRAAIAAGAWMRGGAGDDNLDGGNADTIYFGKEGNDVLHGHEGVDTYIYRSGDGNDFLYDESNSSSSVDTLKLIDLNPADVTFYVDRSQGDDMFIRVNATGQAIKLARQLDGQEIDRLGWGVDRVLFADGTAWDRRQMQAAAWFRGGPGNQGLDGYGWLDNTFDGGTGDDYLHGHEGNDTYVYRSGDGNDFLYDESNSSTSVDTLKLIDLSPADVTFYIDRSQGDDGFIRVNTTGQLIKLAREFDGQEVNRLGWGVDRVVFADGTIWNRQQLFAASWFRGGAGNDSLEGYSNLDNTFHGGAGDDYLHGREGSDTYLYTSGDGSDFLYDQSGSLTSIDTLKFTDLNPSDLTFYADFSQGSDGFIQVNATGHTIKLAAQFLSGGSTPSYGVDRIEFANGVEWDRATLMNQLSGQGSSMMMENSNLEQAISFSDSYTKYDTFRPLNETVANTAPIVSQNPFAEWAHLLGATRSAAGEVMVEPDFGDRFGSGGFVSRSIGYEHAQLA